ncbi:MAG: HDOD domain-containing protein [Campylobacterota bacterium]|nr:HDOD domain-containing protein [Campylobacterota bacterium]
MNNSILQQIKQLPPLPETAIKIESVYRDPESTFADMVSILEKDPLLTADILKSANSPLYGFSREITNISQAVSLFGMGTIRGFALASVISNSFSLDLSPYKISNAQYSKRAENQNALITGWYIRKNPKILGILSAAAFLVDIGKVLIARHVIEHNQAGEFTEFLVENSNTIEVEQKFAQTDTAHVSGHIFDHWRFEEALIETIRDSNDPDTSEISDKLAVESLHVVTTAVTIDGTITPESIQEAKELIAKYGLDLESFETSLANFSE